MLYFVFISVPVVTLFFFFLNNQIVKATSV